VNDVPGLLGYKLNWGLKEEMKLSSLSAMAAVSSNIYYDAISGLKEGKEYVINVWLYSEGGDGPPVTLNIILLDPEPTVPPTTPQPTITTTTTEATSTPAASPVDIKWCRSISPSLGAIKMEVAAGGNQGVNISYHCLSSGSRGHRTVAPIELSLDTPTLIDGLEPDCLYSISVSVIGGVSHQPSVCSINTPASITANDNVNVRIWLNEDYDLMLNWSVSSTLQLFDKFGFLSIQWRVHGYDQQIRYNGTTHVLMTHNDLLLHMSDNVTVDVVTVLHAYHVIYRETYVLSLLNLPPVPSNDGAITHHWLLWAMIASVILVTCAVLVMIILIIIIQRKIKERDKNVSDKSTASESNHYTIQPSNITLPDKREPIIHTSV
jgi:hypothetical protein